MSSTIDFNDANSGRLNAGLLLLVLDSNKLNENDVIIQEAVVLEATSSGNERSQEERVSLQNPCDSTAWTTLCNCLSRNDQSLVVKLTTRVLDFQTFEYVPKV